MGTNIIRGNPCRTLATARKQSKDTGQKRMLTVSAPKALRKRGAGLLSVTVSASLPRRQPVARGLIGNKFLEVGVGKVSRDK